MALHISRIKILCRIRGNRLLRSFVSAVRLLFLFMHKIMYEIIPDNTKHDIDIYT